jgi:hypothetical protein
MSRKSAQRFCDNDMHKIKTSASHKSFNATHFRTFCNQVEKTLGVVEMRLDKQSGWDTRFNFNASPPRAIMAQMTHFA